MFEKKYMIRKKEDVYIDLRGKSKDELTGFIWIFNNIGETLFFRDKIRNIFLNYQNELVIY